MYEIIIGRSESDLKNFGLAGTIFLGKLYVKMGQTTSLSNKVYMDVARSHVILVSGKRGSGKSYSLGVIAEEMCNLPEEISKRLAVVIIDTMGIFWTMKYPNEKDEDLLAEWSLPKKSLDINIYVPSGFYKKYKERKIPADYEFTIKPSELNTGDWCNTFGIQLTDPIGILIERTISKANKIHQEDYSMDDIIKIIHEDPKIDEKTKLAAENRFAAAKEWGLFSSKGTPLKEIIKGGKATVIDISAYTNVSGNWSIKGLVVGLICRKLMSERMMARKISELEDVESGHSYFIYEKEEEKEEMPLVWILIDEAHEFLIKEGSTPATDALVQVLREGRQPGVSLILATQQPGEIHKDVITQTDIVLSHRITARKDIQALNDMMQTYLYGDIQKFLNSLPTDKGSAIILDDNSERMYPIMVRPRFTWHGGEAPAAVKAQGKALQELGL